MLSNAGPKSPPRATTMAWFRNKFLKKRHKSKPTSFENKEDVYEEQIFSPFEDDEDMYDLVPIFSPFTKTNVKHRDSNNVLELPWFYGNLGRKQAEELLHPRIDGLFLVRNSESVQGAYVLSVCFQGEVLHYKIECEEAGLTLDPKKELYFESLLELIEHHTMSANRMKTKLKQPFLADTEPKEILSRGPEAVQAYRNALEHGTVAVFRGRILIIGSDRVGKTSLRKSLCGLQFDSKEPSTVGVDASFCGLDIDHVTSNWQLKEDVSMLNKEILPLMLAKELKSTKDEKEHTVKTGFNYISQAPDVLSFKEGESLILIGEVNGNFCEARNGLGREGLIPMMPRCPNFVEPIQIKALHTYESQKPEELSFEDGEMLTRVESTRHGKGWWKAKSESGREGLVPNNSFVLVPNNLYFLIHHLKALHTFKSEEPFELSFEAGEILTLFKKTTKSWWKARNKRGEEGYIPRNYVKMIDDEELRKMKALYTYESEVPDELLFEVGEILTLLEKTTKHWWKARNERWIEGYIPRNFVEMVFTPCKIYPDFAVKSKITNRLSFDKYEPLTLIKKFDEHFWEARNESGTKGLIPLNFKQLLRLYGYVLLSDDEEEGSKSKPKIQEKNEEGSVARPDRLEAEVPDEVVEPLIDLLQEEGSITRPYGLAAKVPDEVVESLIDLLQQEHLDENIEKEEVIMSIWDFAGQHLYYASHQVFMSYRAVYLLAYNLAKDLDGMAKPCVRQGITDILLDSENNETNLDSMLSWLVSVHTVCQTEKGNKDTRPYESPPVIIVGTHADEPFQDPKEMEKKLKIGMLGKGYQKHVVKPFYTVNNADSSNDEGIQGLHRKIEEVFDKEPYMGEEVPIRWLHFEKALRSIVSERNIYYLRVHDVRNIAKEVCLIEDPDELDVMLNFYQDLGIIIKHGSTVVLDTYWLIDLLKRLITIRNFDDQDPIYTDHWIEMENSGKLSMELVDYVFKEELQCGQVKEDILKMMEHFGLIAAFKQDGTDPCYFVPCQLMSSPRKLLEQSPASHEPCPLYIHFLDGFIPHGLHTRLVCELIPWCNVEPCLYRDASEHFLDMTSKTVLTVIRLKDSIKLLIQSKSTETSSLRGKAIDVRRFVQDILSRLKELCPWYRCLRYEICVSCPSCEKKPCSRHSNASCREDQCLHLLPAIDDQPFLCRKSFGEERWPHIPGFDLWCPEMDVASEIDDPTSSCSTGATTAGPLNLSDNEKRWIVVGITLNTVLIPPLRDYIEPCMESHYEHLKINHNLDKQSHASHLKKDGTATLNYGSINNNDTVRGASNYDYDVRLCVDLAKLYLKPFMAKFTGFDTTCDASAVLGILGLASVFPFSVQDKSKQVKDDVRNKWGHCNIEEWDETKFDESFTTMTDLVTSLGLRPDDEQKLTDELLEWKNQGIQLLMTGNKECEMKLLMEKVGYLSENLSSVVDNDGEREKANKLLKNVKLAIDESVIGIKQDVEALKNRVALLESSPK